MLSIRWRLPYCSKFSRQIVESCGCISFCPCSTNDTEQSFSANFSSQFCSSWRFDLVLVICSPEDVKATAGGVFSRRIPSRNENHAMSCLSFGFDGIVAYTEPYNAVTDATRQIFPKITWRNLIWRRWSFSKFQCMRPWVLPRSIPNMYGLMRIR